MVDSFHSPFSDGAPVTWWSLHFTFPLEFVISLSVLGGINSWQRAVNIFLRSHLFSHLLLLLSHSFSLPPFLFLVLFPFSRNVLASLWGVLFFLNLSHIL